MKKISFLSLIFIVLTLAVQAQKVKYKDLYFLLDTRQYAEAEPFLKRFLADEKNVDHPNANYQMALLMESKSLARDVLTETELLVADIDSTLLYYRNAIKYIDEREVKRNGEYYQAYKRRDIRSGKFGIKLADVHFDMERKMESLVTKRERVIQLKDYYQQMTLYYDTAQQQMKAIKSTYPDTKTLHLRWDETLIKNLNDLQKAYLLAVENYNKYKATAGKITDVGYDQSLHQLEILDYANDGKIEADFIADNIEFWNYNQWAQQVKTAITDKVIPLRERIVLYDRTLNQLKEKLVMDSVSIENDMGGLSMQVMESQLKEFDDRPFPILLFNYKLAELKYLSTLNENSKYKDSLDLVYHFGLIQEKKHTTDRLDSLLTLLEEEEISEEYKNYRHFIDSEFSGNSGVNDFIKNSRSFIDKEGAIQTDELEYIAERLRWLIDETDSIPVFKPDTINLTLKYLPLTIEEHVTTGLYREEDRLQGYFALIDPSRVLKVKAKFAIPDTTFDFDDIEAITGMCTSDENGQINFVMLYQPHEGDTCSAVVSKIYTADGISWTKDMQLSALPTSLRYASATGDLEIISGDKKETTQLVINKKGDIRK